MQRQPLLTPAPVFDDDDEFFLIFAAVLAAR
jgi:hypothetical protein